MSTSEGSIRASLALDIANFKAQVDAALADTARLKAGLQSIPTANLGGSQQTLKDTTTALEGVNAAVQKTVTGLGSVKTNAFVGEFGAARTSVRELVSELGVSGPVANQLSANLTGVSSAAGLVTPAFVGIVGAVTAAAAAMIAATKSAADLEQALAGVKSIKLDLDTKAAEDNLHRISQAVGATAVDLSKALYDIFSSIDVPQEKAIALLEQFSKGAIAAQTDTKTFGTAIIGVLNAYKLSTDDAARVSDLFFNTVKDGVVTGPQLAASLGSVISASKQAGQGLNETFAAMVAITKEGGPAAENLNNLSNLFSKLNTKETAKEFANLGIAVVDGGGKIRQVIDIAKDFVKQTEGMSEAAKAAAKLLLFPDLQARAGFSTLISQIEEADKALAKNRGETGSTEEAYKVLAATSEQNFKRLQASITALSDTFGATLLPAVNAAIDGLTGFVHGMGDAGQAVDEFLANENTRKAAALLMQIKEAATRAPTPTERTIEDLPGGTADTSLAGPAAVLGAAAAPVAKAFTGSGTLAGGAAAGLEEDAKREALERVNDAIRDATRAEAAYQASLQTTVAGILGWTGATETATTATTTATESTTGLLTLVQKLAAGLASGIGVQVDWNEQIKEALGPTSKIAEELRGPFVEGLLKAKQATEDLAKVTQIRDTSIAAQAIALQDAAAKENDVTKAQEKQATATAFVLAAIDAQTKGHAAAAAQATALAKPLDDLAKSIYPALTAQQIGQVEITQKTQGSYAALAAAAAAAAIDVGRFGDLTQLTGQQLADVKKEVDAAAKGFDSFLTDELKSRYSSVLGTLSSGVDAATAALAKQQEAAGHADQALALLLQHAGASPVAITALTQALQAGGAAAFDAQEKIKALVTYARDPNTGTIRLKVDIDIDAAQKAIYDLQNSYRDAQKGRADTESKATHEFGIAQQAAAQTEQQIQTTYKDTLVSIAQARTASNQQLGRDIGAAVKTQNDAATKIDQQIDDAIAKHAQAWADAGDKYQQAIKDATTALSQGLEGLAQRAQDIIQQAADAAAQALRAVSGAMQSFNDQARITANQTSIQQQSAQLASYGFTDFQSQQSALRATQIQAEGTAGLAQVAGANQLNQTLVGANQALQKATEKAGDEMSKLSREITKLYTAYNTANDKAGQALEKADRDAAAAEEKAIRDANQALQQNTRTVADAISHAEADRDQRNKALRDQADAAQQKFVDDNFKIYQERINDPKGKFRTNAEQAFEEAEIKRRKDQADADKKYLEDLKKADATLDALLALKDLPELTAEAIVARFNASPQQFTYNGLTVLETQVDFQAAATAEIARRVRSKT